MNYLIDTNIISQVRKGERCDGHVAAWFAAIDDEDIFLSVLARRTDPAQARALEKWLSTLKQSYAERILPIDQVVADEWGSMSAIRPLPTVDALLAATAKIHRMTLVTRNFADVAGLGADVLNPFEPPASRR